MATNRIQDYIKSGKYFDFPKKIEKLSNGETRITDDIDWDKLVDFEFVPHVEPRIRKDDLTEALSMKVYDPLWMLSRQWQMGEFRGNNTGTAVSVKCVVRQEDCSKEPIEPATEQINPDIDLLVRVESAMHYLEMRNDPQYEATPAELHMTMDQLREVYCINWEDGEKQILDCDATRKEERALNAQRLSFVNSFRNRAFDGYKLYVAKKRESTKLAKAYTDWFEQQYFPAGTDGSSNSHWKEQSLNYEIDLTAGSRHFIGDRYQGGRLSWYTVDDATSNNVISGKTETVASLPTPAQYPGAPNKRLWQFEDRRVFMGNSSEQQTKANEMFLKFATLYSNDWMLIPLKTDIGKYIVVSEVEVKNTFGVTQKITRRSGFSDATRPLEEPWQMFTNTKYGTTDGKQVGNGLFYAPQLVTTIEGKPIEEVEILRDEMANMVWGVEKTVSDGCGFTLDEQLRAIQLKTIVDDFYEQYREKPEPGKVTFNEDGGFERKNGAQSDYRYTLQTHVPYNWIPFLPEHVKDKNAWGGHFDLWGREMVLRRGKMPCYILTEKGFERKPVLPVSSILRKGLDGNSYRPLFINEEEVQQTGIRLTKNYQRARWLNGKTYLWLGMYKKLAKFSEKSGLEFDTLHKK